MDVYTEFSVLVQGNAVVLEYHCFNIPNLHVFRPANTYLVLRSL